MLDEKKIKEMLAKCDRQIDCFKGGRSEYTYHSIRQTLHSLWHARAQGEAGGPIGEINERLEKLEKRTNENEHKKYLNYYPTAEMYKG